jgi:hypothetical protein
VPEEKDGKRPDYTGILGRWNCRWCNQEWPEYTTYHAMKARARAQENHPGKQCEPDPDKLKAAEALKESK